eukprot:c34643_g1_i1 orf=25-240(-)
MRGQAELLHKSNSDMRARATTSTNTPKSAKMGVSRVEAINHYKDLQATIINITRCLSLIRDHSMFICLQRF